ncbi:hypothetical protein GCM10011391_27420 [Pullulanibacillus camelliae]|uniref:YqzL family protein n=1 Tax=Pullulanibacillus camelliae TaxID=1707096 RepID=A0A8J3DWM7_9BACL|nr:YqzL family protein [Pullulanibacillus camelliae]GGE47111.1 hypothetical protein GCM10011391_27420 [Pullulanibacillus camelliae]
MLDFTWKVFCMTGNVDTYLLYKEVEKQDEVPDFEEGSQEDEQQPTH